eukprot:TRINITY_DN2881_c0_g1_i2.p1 TRINITY_DN2881_c0_g1~~TRINITY_DN2881_c0_g1_i2.p1  ORF type:complete len:280 (+),score=59.13 TRINITY_DN2881_c0_g1_i2:86-841(+)
MADIPEKAKKKFGNLPKRLLQIHSSGGRKYFDSADNLLNSIKPVAPEPPVSASPSTPPSDPAPISHPAPEAPSPIETSTDPDSIEPASNPEEEVTITERLAAIEVIPLGQLSPSVHHDRVLVVDHSDAALRVMQVALSRAKYHVELARDGTEMLQKAATTDCRIVVFNTQLPDMSGVEVVRRIRSSELEQKREPALLFGLGQTKVTLSEMQEYIEAGLDGHLYAGSILAKELTSFIQKKRLNPGQFLLSNG